MSRTLAPAAKAESRIVLRDISWSLYQQIAAARGDRPVPRLSYFHGVLELMSPSYYHDFLARTLNLFVLMIARGSGMTCRSAGSARWEKVGLDAGKEPDECFYLENEPLVRGLREIDLAIHPPPDLAIEIELTNPLNDALRVYAALGVPEVWRCGGDTLRFLHLQADGSYRESETSRSFPDLRVADVRERLARAEEEELIGWSIAVEAFARGPLAERALARARGGSNPSG